MSRKLIACLLCGIASVSFAQDVSVEKSVFGIQTGFLGVWVHNEAKLSNEIALRSEIGLDSGIFMSGIYDSPGFFMTPVVTLEPRWYYNLEKRSGKSKNISNNSGNFLSLKTSYHPDWFVISDHENLRIIPDLSIVPTWGIRRTLGNHFTYETGIGIGYMFVSKTDDPFVDDQSTVAVNLHLRIGYTF